MSLSQNMFRNVEMKAFPQFDTNLGKLEVNQSIELLFKISCKIPQVKVVCEQEMDEEKEKEVETKSIIFPTTSSKQKNLKITFKANRGGIVTLLFKIETLKINKTLSNNDLKAFEQRIELRYQTKFSIVDVIPENEIRILEEIGKSSEATIYKARYNGEIVVIKTYEPGYGTEESEKLLCIKNKYIVDYKRSFYREIDNQRCFCSMLEYSEHGSLENVKQLIGQSILYKIMEDVCKALKYLHQVKNVIHRDIKPQNILTLNSEEICDVNAKITYFFTCDVINNKDNYEYFDSKYFTAPEVIKGEKYTNKCDIYSLGITMLSLFLRIGFENCISDVIQPNGTYIKTTAHLKSDIRKLIIKCCKVDPLKRPNINECLNAIQEIRKTFNDKEIFQTINIEEIGVKYSIPKFDLLKSIKDVVESIKKLNITNDFIKAKIMLKFKIDIKEAFTLMNNSHSLIDNKGDNDYALAQYYLETNDFDSMNNVYELMMSAARKSQPDAILYLINILIDIADNKITIYDKENNRIYGIVNEIYDLGILHNKQKFHFQCPTQKTINNTISTTIIIDIFSILRKYLPLCEFHYGIALLHDIGINNNSINSELMFNNFKQSEYCNDPQEVEFYQSYCKFMKNNIQETYREAHSMLDNCIMNSEQQHYYSYALNNKGVLLYNGFGCEKDINKSFEYFEKSMELNNSHGKFNHTYCLFKHTEILTSEIIHEDIKTIMIELANNGLVFAQQFCALYNYLDYLDCKRNDLIQQSIYWWVQSSLQLNDISIYNLGLCLKIWSEEQNEDRINECKEIAFTLFNIASQSNCFGAHLSLINCYRYGEGTEKNLEEAINFCKKALQNIDNKEFINEELKIKAIFLYLSVLKEIHLQNIDAGISGNVLELLEIIDNIDNSKINIELGKCYYSGDLFEKDINKAIKYYERAAKKNDAEALSSLGAIYFNGDGVKKDINKAIEYYEKAANLNNSNALNLLGRIYSEGDVNEKDTKKTIKYYNKTLNQNQSNAFYYFGSLYYNGDGVKKDIKKGIGYFEKAANLNNSDALNKLGGIYFEGSGVKKDIHKAIGYLEKAANLNNPTALYNLGMIYLNGEGVKKNINKAIKCLEGAANQNDADALNILGDIYYKGDCGKKDMKKAIECFEKSANLNNLTALYMLSKIYSYGEGVKKDMNKAFDYYSRTQNDVDSLNRLGVNYYSGNGVKKDIKKAIEYFEKSANQNNKDSLYMLGFIYSNGDGVEKDINKAIKYLEKAANQNDGDALYILGNIYHKGDGVKKDVKKAIECFEKAANQNNKDSLHMLGVIYSNGDDVEKDINKAIKYLEKAANQNDEDSIQLLKKIKFN